MTGLVVDASAATAWLLESQASARGNALLEDWADHDGHAPYVFPGEVRSFLLKAERRAGFPAAATHERLEVLAALGILVAPALELGDMDEVLELARRSGLAFHDALYLDLALQKQVALASRDGLLIAAAKKAGVDVFDLRD